MLLRTQLFRCLCGSIETEKIPSYARHRFSGLVSTSSRRRRSTATHLQISTCLSSSSVLEGSETKGADSEMEMEGAVLVLSTLMIVVGFTLLYTFSGPGLATSSSKGRQGLRVPRGKLWYLPWLGETLDLLFSDVDDFLRRHVERYGETFSTHVFGGPAVVTTSKEALEFCLATPQGHHALRAIYSNDILGRDSLSMVPAGARHTALRKLLQHQLLAPEAVRGFCSAMSETARSCLASWAQAGTVVTEDEGTRFAFRVVLRFTCGMDHSSCTPEEIDELLHLFADMENGLMSLPIDVPGSGKRRSLDATKQVRKFAEKLIAERRRVPQPDGLTTLMEAKIVEASRSLGEGEVLDNLLLLLGAGHRAPGIFLTWVVKMLAEHPHILEQVQAEQDVIAKNMQLEGRHLLTWEDTKKMELTWRVIQETMRFVTPAAFVMRKARKDLAFKGILIPKGWKVLVFWRSVHMNPEVHPNPKVFDPSRFERPMAPHSFTPFGLGPRGCVGNDFAKQELLVFVHHLVTTYTWKPVYPNEKIKQWPIACLSKGLPISLWPRHIST